MKKPNENKQDSGDIQDKQEDGISADGLPMQSINEGYNPLNWYTNEKEEEK